MTPRQLVPLVLLLGVVGAATLVLGTILEPAGHTHDAPGNDALFAEAGVTTMPLTMMDIAYAPTEIRAASNSLIELGMKNDGRLDHDFTVERIDVDQAVRRDGSPPAAHQHVDQYAVHVALSAGQQARLRLHLHAPGRFEFFCTVPGHREAGMRGTVVVE